MVCHKRCGGVWKLMKYDWAQSEIRLGVDVSHWWAPVGPFHLILEYICLFLSSAVSLQRQSKKFLLTIFLFKMTHRSCFCAWNVCRTSHCRPSLFSLLQNAGVQVFLHTGVAHNDLSDRFCWNRMMPFYALVFPTSSNTRVYS